MTKTTVYTAKNTSPEHKPSGCQCDCNCHSKKADLKSSERAPTTPVKKDQDALQLTPSSKRRRLISFDSKSGEELDDSSTGKLNYETSLPSDVSEGSVDDIDSYEYEEARRKIVKKLWEVNYGDEDDRLLQTCSKCKLYEFVTYYDAPTGKMLCSPPWLLSDEEQEELQKNGSWKYRGKGCVKFIQTLEEGYNCGMTRMEMIHDGTLNTLMCHELLDESIMPMTCKKGKSFTWKCKDWAYKTMERTFAIRFDDELEAIRWKSLVEDSKNKNKNIRRGIDVPESKEVNELSSVLKRMCTM